MFKGLPFSKVFAFFWDVLVCTVIVVETLPFVKGYVHSHAESNSHQLFISHSSRQRTCCGRQRKRKWRGLSLKLCSALHYGVHR